MTSFNNDAYLDGNYETIGESTKDIYDNLTPSECYAGYIHPVPGPSKQGNVYTNPIPGPKDDTRGDTSQDTSGDAMPAERQITCKNLPWWAWTNIVLGVLLAACIITLIVSLVPSKSIDPCIYTILNYPLTRFLLLSYSISVHQLIFVNQITHYC